jgi:hypothetical protein
MLAKINPTKNKNATPYTKQARYAKSCFNFNANRLMNGIVDTSHVMQICLKYAMPKSGNIEHVPKISIIIQADAAHILAMKCFIKILRPNIHKQRVG